MAAAGSGGGSTTGRSLSVMAVFTYFIRDRWNAKELQEIKYFIRVYISFAFNNRRNITKSQTYAMEWYVTMFSVFWLEIISIGVLCMG